jgi:hypothetical protein
MLMDVNLLVKATKPKIKYNKGTTKNIKLSLDAFLNNETGVFGNYVATKNALVYRSLSVVDDFNQDVLLLRLVKNNKVYYIGNSSRLSFCGSNVAFGHRSRSWGATEIQELLQKNAIPMLPFDSFTESGLKLIDCEILAQSGPETVKRIVGKNKDKSPRLEDVHFTGASLFKIGNQCFLFDIDREEIKHGIFNPFIVNLPKVANSIADAYDSLIPEEVKQEMNKGKTILRQGEYFFIKTDNMPIPDKMNRAQNWDRLSGLEDSSKGFMRGVLSAQGNREHVTSFINRKTGLVSGTVYHMGREHNPLKLDGWFLPVPNTAVRSFTLTGDVD